MPFVSIQAHAESTSGPCKEIDLEYYRLKSSLALQKLALFYLTNREQGTKSLEQVLIDKTRLIKGDAELEQIRQKFVAGKLEYVDRMSLLLKSEALIIDQKPTPQSVTLDAEDFQIMKQVAEVAKTAGYQKNGGVTDFVSMVSASFHRDDKGRWKNINDFDQQLLFARSKVRGLRKDFSDIQIERELKCGADKKKPPRVTMDSVLRYGEYFALPKIDSNCEACEAERGPEAESIDAAILEVAAKGELMLNVKKTDQASRPAFNWTCGPSSNRNCREDAVTFLGSLKVEAQKNPKFKALLAKYEASPEMKYVQPNFRVTIGPFADHEHAENFWREVEELYKDEVSVAVSKSVEQNPEVMQRFTENYYKRVHPKATIETFCGGKADWSKCRYLQSVLRCTDGVGLDLYAKTQTKGYRGYFLNELICHSMGMGLVD